MKTSDHILFGTRTGTRNRIEGEGLRLLTDAMRAGIGEAQDERMKEGGEGGPNIPQIASRRMMSQAERSPER